MNESRHGTPEPLDATAMTWLAHQALAAPEGHWDELRGLTNTAAPSPQDPAQMSEAWQTFIQHLGAEGCALLGHGVQQVPIACRQHQCTLGAKFAGQLACHFGANAASAASDERALSC